MPGLILGLHPANERRCYFVTTSLIGWVQAWNQHWIHNVFTSSGGSKFKIKRSDLYYKKLKRMGSLFGDVIVASYTGSNHFDNLRCSRWRPFRFGEPPSARSQYHLSLYLVSLWSLLSFCMLFSVYIMFVYFVLFMSAIALAATVICWLCPTLNAFYLILSLWPGVPDLQVWIVD